VRRPSLILLLVAASASAGLGLACDISNPTITLECAAPDTSSYISINGTTDTVRVHCFQKSGP
jgi:hypothetical protein